MLTIFTNPEGCFEGEATDKGFQRRLNLEYESVVRIEADDAELEICCEMLGRSTPTLAPYSFLDTNAREIAFNWKANHPLLKTYYG